ncbi:MAG TPA: hypothetical protein VNZ45_05000 [Bacteroidia bacterium]|jgi:hypothetical protein|nr:hypothetical protein [Bacteroidia bacterium]
MRIVSFFLKNYRTVFLLTAITIVIVCCKSTQPATTKQVASQNTSPPKSPLMPTESDVAIAGTHWQGTTIDNLNQGYSIFDDKCTDCHGVKKPQDFTVEEWNSIMPKMGRKAKLDSTQYNMVFRYILTKREALLGPGR